MMRIGLSLCLTVMIGACAPQTEKPTDTTSEEKTVPAAQLSQTPADYINTQKESYKQAPEALKAWVTARAGTGEPVHWVAEGGVFAYPSGEKLFGLIGFDSSIVKWPDNPADPVLHLTRKTFAYTDKDTGEVLKTYQDNPVEPIAYPYQMITSRFEDGRIYGDVEQGVGDNIRQIKSTDGTAYRKVGNTNYYNASVFLDFPLPSGAQYEVW